MFKIKHFITVLVIVAGGGAYYFVKQKQLASSILPQQTTSLPPQTQSSVPSDWKTYRNEKYGFEFAYPPLAKLHINQGNREILSDNAIEFEQESTFYNLATISFFVYKKNVFRVPERIPIAGVCDLYEQSTKIINGKSVQILE